MKIYVYAVCRCEEKAASQWAKSMSEADGIFVLGTGESDKTVTLLKEMGITVKTMCLSPFRYDTAKNKALAMVPGDADLCVCTNLDETFSIGWRKALEQAYKPQTKQMRCRYVRKNEHNPDLECVSWAEAIHARRHFRWKKAINEELHYTCRKACLSVDAGAVELYSHRKDNEKQDLSLLELAVSEDACDIVNLLNLGRRYWSLERWLDCSITLQRYLNLAPAAQEAARSAAMRLVAMSQQNLGLLGEAQSWLLRACAEGPMYREPWLALAKFLKQKGEWPGVMFCAQRALNIEKSAKNGFDEEDSWGSLPYDLAAIAAWHSGNDEQALLYGSIASEKAPQSARLKSNLEYYISGK